jgi:hypothetical protein
MGWYFFDRDPASKHPPHASLRPELYSTSHAVLPQIYSRLTLPAGCALSLLAHKLRASGQMEAGRLSEILRDGQGEMGVTVKEFVSPLRYALTGETVREHR